METANEKKKEKIIVPRFKMYMRKTVFPVDNEGLILYFEDRLTEKVFHCAVAVHPDFSTNLANIAEIMSQMLSEMLHNVHKEGLIEGYDITHAMELKQKSYTEMFP